MKSETDLDKIMLTAFKIRLAIVVQSILFQVTETVLVMGALTIYLAGHRMKLVMLPFKIMSAGSITQSEII